MTQTNQTTKTSARSNTEPKLPSHIAKLRHGFGKKATYERIGVMFTNDDGSFYLKLAGKQVIDKGIYLYKLEDKKDVAADDAAPVEDGEYADEEAGE